LHFRAAFEEAQRLANAGVGRRRQDGRANDYATDNFPGWAQVALPNHGASNAEAPKTFHQR
jgi:hypothetical protein